MDIEDPISIETRIQVLYEAGITKPQTLLDKLTNFTDMNIRTMQRKVEKLNNGQSLARKQYHREPTVMTEEVKENIRETVQRQDVFTISDLKAKGEIEASRYSIWNFLQEEDYHYEGAVEKPLLTENQIIYRLEFCRKYKGMKKLVNQGLFCNESTFYCNSQPKFKWVKEGELYQSFQPKYPYKINQWGGICKYGATDLKIFEGNMNGEIYKSIVENEIINSAKRLFQRKKWILIEDNYPKHLCNTVKETRNKLNIVRLDEWPSCSLDLNPVENI